MTTVNKTDTMVFSNRLLGRRNRQETNLGAIRTTNLGLRMGERTKRCQYVWVMKQRLSDWPHNSRKRVPG